MSSTATSDQIGDLDVVDLGVVEAVVQAWCATVDPVVLAGTDAASGAERLAVTIRRLEAVQLLLAKRAADCNAYAARAHSGADWLATLNGTSKAEAARALDTAKRLESCPDTKAAFSAGEISKDEADAVSGAANADPTCERRLLDGAKARHDLRETRTAADKARRAARSAEDEAARQQRLHTSRSLRISEGPEGHVEIRGRFTPSAFAGVKPILDAHMKTRVDQARRDGTRDSWDAYRADSFLAAITTSATAGGTRAAGGTRRTAAPTTTGATAAPGAAAPPPKPDPTPGPFDGPVQSEPATTPGPFDRPAQSNRDATPGPFAGPPQSNPATTPGPFASPAQAEPDPAPGPFDAPAPAAAPVEADTATARVEAGPGPPPATTTATATADADAATAVTATDAVTPDRLFAPGDEIHSATGLDPKINWNLVILIDGIALKRGYAAPGETCEIPGIGTIPVAWIKTLLPHVHTEMLIHDSVDIRAYATTTRHRTRPVDLAVRVRDRDCTTPRCHHDITEIDHITDYADTHDTSVANLHGFCTTNHDDKTYRNATFTRDDTNWNWWPPNTNPATTPPITAPIGHHLTQWNLDHLPSDDPDHHPNNDPDDPPTLEYDP